MGRASVVCASCLVFASTFLSIAYKTSPVLERPIQSAIVILFVASSAFCVLCSTFPQLLSPPQWPSELADDAGLPLRDLPSSQDSKKLPLSDAIASHFVKLSTRTVVITTGLALALRVEIFRNVSANRACAVPGIEALTIPAIAWLEYWEASRRRQDEQSSPWVSRGAKLFYEAFHGRARYLLPAMVFGSAYFFTALASNVRSTYICSVTVFSAKAVPLLQLVAVALNVWILLASWSLAEAAHNTSRPPTRIRYSLLTSWAALSAGGLLFTVTNVQYWKWIFGIDSTYLISVLGYSLVLTLSLFCTLSLLPRWGLLPLLLLLHIVCVHFSNLMNKSIIKGAFPPASPLLDTVSIVLSYLGTALAWGAASTRTPDKFSISPLSLNKILVVLLILQLYFQMPRNKLLDHHPIDNLLQESLLQASGWVKQASVSQSVGDAVAQYRGRYGRYPPPRFDVWYEYAKHRSSMVIDNFDRMYDDLEPFWDMSPAEIRLRTGQALSDPWNEVADIVVRSGKAEIGPKILATHRWMLEGIIAMIQPFALYIPDMDLAFNINDEPRVAVPYKKMIVAQGPEKGGLPFDGWTDNRHNNWPLVENPIHTFTDRSFTKNFYDYGSVACPPGSAARVKRIWDASELCSSCAAPHSSDGFLSNWTLSASPCHQPDLTNLHGFYLSPAAFKPSHELFPVFSQSKAHGYSDILYPSAWNYMDKAKYEPTDDQPDPPFAEKENTLFWRGATSEGLSRHGAWKGMTRQRLVHLTNNSTSSDQIALLLPHSSKVGQWEYAYGSSQELEETNLSTDIAIVDDIARCWDSDCDDQAAEFGLAGKTDFQAHWKYRYLFDMDGAGFSGRFLPFLQSHSLPFKTALFREWYDDRLTAWTHFVPLDLRLHGVYSTLSYFAGLKTAKGTLMEERVKEGEKIAEQGREWAGKVLRKEDMEIYMFRLLLEWGRLTDDNRDTIGYSG